MPDQDPHEIDQLVIKYVEQIHKERGTPTTCKVSAVHSAKAWVSDFNHPHYVAGRKAVKTGTIGLLENVS